MQTPCKCCSSVGPSFRESHSSLIGLKLVFYWFFVYFFVKDNFVWGEIQPSDMRFHKDILKLGKLEISWKNNHIDGLSPHAKSSHMGWISPPKIHLMLVESHLVGVTLPNTYLEMLCYLTEWINSHTQNAESHLTWLLRVTEVILYSLIFWYFCWKKPKNKNIFAIMWIALAIERKRCSVDDICLLSIIQMKLNCC